MSTIYQNRATFSLCIFSNNTTKIRIHMSVYTMYIFFQSLKLDTNRTMALELRFLIKEVFQKEGREK